MSQPFCADKLNPAGLISVRATLPIYLIDQVSSLQRRAERRNGKFKKIMKTRNILISIRYRISRRISRVSGHQNRGQKIDLDLYEGHIISVVRLLIKNLACLAICSF